MSFTREDSVWLSLPADTRQQALDVLVSFTYGDYADQVLDYLDPESPAEYEGGDRRDDIRATLLGLLDKADP